MKIKQDITLQLFNYRRSFFLIIIFFFSAVAIAQNDSAAFFTPAKNFNQKRFNVLLATESSLYTGSFIGLNKLWYTNYKHSSFHFFNDNNEWLQMDKVGHFVTSYKVGKIGIDLLKWSGVERKKAIWYGGALGSLFLSTVEIFDGFSSGWGFSTGDLMANTLGSGLLIGEELAWNEQRIVMKFSFNQSRYAIYRPSLLGNTYLESLLKDYNGQTYWMSVNVSSFLTKENKFPKWLNVAFGYGAEGMTGGDFNPAYTNSFGKQIFFERYRQYYISLDIDLTKIKTDSNVLKGLFKIFSFIKIPSPTVEFNKKGMKFNPLYF